MIGHFKKYAGRRNENGYLMPVIVILMVVMTSVAYATLIQSNNSLNLAYKEAYIQMAREASKAAIDYAQEQFDNANCGNYGGTAETALSSSSNTRYKVTMQADVQSTSSDGFEKKVIGTGRVYLPKTSSSALYLFDVRSEIVRTYAVCKAPDNFAPLLWLDASNTGSLKKDGTNITTLAPINTSGGVGGSTSDTLKERADNGSQTAASWSSNDFQMNTCNAADFTNSICNSNSTKYLNLGLIYQNVNIPQNATITSASITLACTNPSGTSGSLTDNIYGFYKASSNPHPDLFTQNGSNQLYTPLNTPALHTSSFATATSNNCPPGNNTVYDVTNVVQEVVNNTNWSNGSMGFAFKRISGAGSRHFLKAGNQLSISYSTTTVSQAANGDSLGEWDDISGNNNNAVFTYGSAPTRVDNQINAKPIVRFNNGALLANLTTALSAKRELTAFAVLKPNFSTSGSAGRVISGMTTTATSDISAGNGIIPIRRQASATGFSNLYDSNSADGVNMGCNPTCSSTPYLVSSVFTIDSTTNKIISTLKGNGGTQTATLAGINPGSPPPSYTYSINQLYIGGRRTGALPGSGTDYFNGDYAEIVVYDHALSCHQIEDLEEYFRSKWNISPTQWTSTCPADDVPTL